MNVLSYFPWYSTYSGFFSKVTIWLTSSLSSSSTKDRSIYFFLHWGAVYLNYRTWTGYHAQYFRFPFFSMPDISIDGNSLTTDMDIIFRMLWKKHRKGEVPKNNWLYSNPSITSMIPFIKKTNHLAARRTITVASILIFLWYILIDCIEFLLSTSYCKRYHVHILQNSFSARIYLKLFQFYPYFIVSSWITWIYTWLFLILAHMEKYFLKKKKIFLEEKLKKLQKRG